MFLLRIIDVDFCAGPTESADGWLVYLATNRRAFYYVPQHSGNEVF